MPTTVPRDSRTLERSVHGLPHPAPCCYRVLTLAVLLALVLAGCGTRDASQETQSAPEEKAPPVATAPPDTTKGPLRRGIGLPSVQVLDIEGRPADIRSLIGGKDTIIFFLSTSCEVCHDMMVAWTSEPVPEGLNILAVVEETVEYGRGYAEKEKFPFPLYMDTRHVFSRLWSVNEYPTVAGVRADGFIVYARKGVAPELFTPSRAETLLVRGKEMYGKAG